MARNKSPQIRKCVLQIDQHSIALSRGPPPANDWGASLCRSGCLGGGRPRHQTATTGSGSFASESMLPLIVATTTHGVNPPWRISW